jgi:hypothetical protein
MPTAQQDTEITLGTGRMLTIFFALVLVCALFFSFGFSLGKKTSQAVGNSLLNLPSGTPAVVVRPSAVKNNSSQTQSGDFSFYKAVGEKTSGSALSPQGKHPRKQPPMLAVQRLPRRLHLLSVIITVLIMCRSPLSAAKRMRIHWSRL